MDLLKKFWPSAFKLEKKVVKPFVIQLVIYVLIGVVLSIASVLLGLLNIAIVNVLMSIICGIVDLYCTAGIVFSILRFTGVFKD